MKPGDTEMDNVINDLEIAKRILASPLSLDMSMRIKVGQTITEAIELLKRFKAREMTIDNMPSNERGNNISKWIFHSHNPSYSPFDGSLSEFYRCSNCGYVTGNRTKHCPECGQECN